MHRGADEVPAVAIGASSPFWGLMNPPFQPRHRRVPVDVFAGSGQSPVRAASAREGIDELGRIPRIGEFAVERTHVAPQDEPTRHEDTDEDP